MGAGVTSYSTYGAAVGSNTSTYGAYGEAARIDGTYGAAAKTDYSSGAGFKSRTSQILNLDPNPEATMQRAGAQAHALAVKSMTDRELATMSQKNNSNLRSHHSGDQLETESGTCDLVTT